jgi:hypothetical protein
MSECVNWPILLAIVGAALGLFLILLLAGGFLMRCLDARGRADADRLPVVAKNEPEWLGEEPADLPRLKALLAPYPSEEMMRGPVSVRVGNVRNNDPSLIEPVALAGYLCDFQLGGGEGRDGQKHRADGCDHRGGDWRLLPRRGIGHRRAPRYRRFKALRNSSSRRGGFPCFRLAELSVLPNNFGAYGELAD